MRRRRGRRRPRRPATARSPSRPRSSAGPRSSACAAKGSIPTRTRSPAAPTSRRSKPPTTPRRWARASTSGFTYRVMGRVTGKRGHGKTAFLDVRDITGTIQAYARRDVLGEEAFGRVEDLDIGDLVGIEGPLHVTKRGQLAIGVRECVAAGEGAERPARPLPRHLRSRHALPPARTRPDGERGLARDLQEARRPAVRDPHPHARARLGRAGNAGPAAADRRRRGASVCHPPQRARPRALPPHGDRAVPEAGDRRRLRGRLRVRQVLPQRGDVAPAQPRVHDAGDVRRRCRLQRRHGVHRGPGLDRRREGDGDDEGAARRGRDRLRRALAAGAAARRAAARDRARHLRGEPRRAGRGGRRRRRPRTTTGPGSSTPCRASSSSRS